jgi:hypothetical protein
MINFQISSILTILKFLRLDNGHCMGAAATEGGISQLVSEAQAKIFKNHFDYIAAQCAKLLLERADSRIARMAGLFQRRFSYAELSIELGALYEAIEDDLQFERFYHYQRQKGFLLLKLPGDWATTIKAFPSTRLEIEDAVDCFASDHPTASVFHLMRIAEYGLRALARERKISLPKGKPIEWATWQDILTQIDDSVNGKAGIGKTAKAGPGKDDALAFYNGALGHFLAFKDQYRNAVSHVRKRYEEWEAEIALNHVRDFMNGLSLKLNEGTRGPLRWKF